MPDALLIVTFLKVVLDAPPIACAPVPLNVTVVPRAARPVAALLFVQSPATP